MDCNCPEESTLTDIITLDCEVNMGQIQKLIFQRGGYEFDQAGTPTPSDIKTLSVWQGLLSATDDTKAVLTPFIGGDPVIEPGEAITVGGGDNSTLNGVVEVQGTNPSNFSAVFKGLPAETETQIKKLMCEKDLVVYFLLQGGKIGAVKIATGKYKGFPVQSLFLSDRGNQGFGTKDVNNFSFSLAEGWSAGLEVVTPNFNPLTDLVA